MPVDVLITDEMFQQVMMPMGYPVLSLPELSNGMLSEEQVRKILIWPALQIYFKFFPIEEQVELFAAGNFSFDFPDEWTYGVTDCRVISRPVGAPVLTTSPFANEIFFRTGKSQNSGYGSRYNYDMGALHTLQQMESQGNIESWKSLRTIVNRHNRTISGYTTTEGRLLITWAKYSNDTEKVDFHYQQDFLELAQAYVKEYFGSIDQRSTAQLPTNLNGDNLVESARATKERVLESWKAATKVIIMRN